MNQIEDALRKIATQATVRMWKSLIHCKMIICYDLHRLFLRQIQISAQIGASARFLF